MTAPLRTALLTAFSMLALYLIDLDLARIEQHELQAEAATAFRQAEAQHDVNAAIPLYRRAVTLQRESRPYQLGLARALVKAGKHSEAATLLQSVIAREPNDGAANVEMARLLRSTGDVPSASAYYHRSIYGKWPASEADRPRLVRLELAAMLAENHRSRDLLAELLLLEDDARDRPDLQPQIARWYMTAGSPSRAVAEYRRITATPEASPEAWTGLGDAELAVGDYRAAQVAYSTALRRGSKDAAKNLVLAVELADLDPTLRRMSGAERLRRANVVLARAGKVLAACPTADPDLQARASAAKTKEPTEILDLAEDTWRYAAHACPAATESDRTLQILMERLAQHP